MDLCSGLRGDVSASARPYRELHCVAIALEGAARSADDVDHWETWHTFVAVKRLLNEQRRAPLHESEDGAVLTCLEFETQQSIFPESTSG